MVQKNYSHPSLTKTTSLFLVTAGDIEHCIKTLRLAVVFNCQTFLGFLAVPFSEFFLIFKKDGETFFCLVLISADNIRTC